MHARSGPRNRTRRQWDEHFKNLWNEAKGKKGSGSNARAGVDRKATVVVDSESAVVDDNMASEVRPTLGNKKFGLGKEVVSDVSSLKTGLESGYGSRSNVGNLDGWDGSVAPKTISDSITDSGNSSSSIDGSDGSESEDDDISDEDYKVDEQTSSSDVYEDEDEDYDKEETEIEEDCADEKLFGKIESDEEEACREGDVEIICEDEFHGIINRGANIDKKAEEKLEGFGKLNEPCSDGDHVLQKIDDEDGQNDHLSQDHPPMKETCSDNDHIVQTIDTEDGQNNCVSQHHPCTKDEFSKKEPETKNKASKAGDIGEFWMIVSERKDVGTVKRRKILELGNADEGDGKEDVELASQCHPRMNLKFQKNESDPRDFGSSLSRVGDFFPSSSRKNKSLNDRDEMCIDGGLLSLNNYLKVKFYQKSRAQKSSELTKILVESIYSLKKEQYPIEDDPPLRFRFEDEVQQPPTKSEWEKEMDSLFSDLELGLRESDIEFMSSCVTDNGELDSTESDKSSAGFCGPGKHQLILDEQIGVVCEFCSAVILDIKYVLPDFHTPRLGKRKRVNLDESPTHAIDNQIWFRDSKARNPSSSKPVKGGTVWDLIPGIEKEMYPHQRQGFEFMWRNLAGDIRIDKLKQPLSGEGRGCIISHTPGSGKTRLTIMFLVSFLKLYPTCRPVIIAPRGILATWQQEFIKWRVDIPFHNLNKMKLCGDENEIASNMTAHVGGGAINRDHFRLVKLCAWMKGRRILGISYQLFEKLSAANGKGQMPEVRKILLEMPGLLVLDEGHTPRNDQSRLWNSLMEVATRRRIILSGTPFQNNLDELHNTLRIVNPEFVDQIGPEHDPIHYEVRGRPNNNMNKKRWARLTCSIDRNMDRLVTLRRLLDPFIHVYKGSILEEQLPGLSECLVFLQPTELQNILLETAANKAEFFDRIQLVSLISVHPSILLMKKGFSLSSLPVQRSKLEEIESNIDAGAKTKFVMTLILLADALEERVLIFSQFINPLVFIKKRIISHFSWTEGKQVLYMDGQLDERQRQESIMSFNDETSEAKVLLASERACSEGISLVGASRVVLLDTVWNPSVEKQAVSRAYRLGQKKFVYVYRLFTSGVEVRKYAQQIKKERISELIVSPLVEESSKDGWVSVSEDKILDTMMELDCIEKIVAQPKKSDLLEIFGLME